MNKLKAIIVREYVQGVRSRAFLISTVIGPVMMVVFTVVPGLLFGLKTGGAPRGACLDHTRARDESVRENVLREDDAEDGGRPPQGGASARRAPDAPRPVDVRYEVEAVEAGGRPLEEVKRALNGRLQRNELDAYVVIPPDILETSRAQYYARNLGDVITISRLEDRLSRAVKEQRMRGANISPEVIRAVSAEVTMSRHKPDARGEEEEGGSFFLALAVGIFIYVAILMYGQGILSAVVEEKTTRIVELLFSSVRAFTLIMGKLVGVSLVALTQYAIWALLFAAVSLYGVGMAAAAGLDVSIPRVEPLLAVYALLFFLLGFYVYATLYAVVGAMVTSEKEGGQLAFPVIMLLMVGIYIAFPVIRSPGSNFSFWVSMVPFFSPITMLVRIVTETPPFWQIALSLLTGLATVVGLVWVAGRIYRTGMLMYGKRATIPEVLRWVRRA